MKSYPNSPSHLSVIPNGDGLSPSTPQNISTSRGHTLKYRRLIVSLLFFRRKFSILMALPSPNRCRPPNLSTHTLNFLKDSRNAQKNAQALVQVFPFKGTTIIHTEAGSNEIAIKLLIGGQFPVKIGKDDIWLISIFN